MTNALNKTRGAGSNNWHNVSVIKTNVSKAFLAMIEAKEEKGFTKKHSERVSIISRKIAEQIENLGKHKNNFLMTIQRAGLLHDIGKVGIPNSIIYKKGLVSRNEKKIINNHPSIGFGILKTVSFFNMEAIVALQHHELMDGSGYPFGLRNKDILIHSRIVCIADYFDALVSNRPYRAGFHYREIAEKMISEKDKYDEKMLSILRRLTIEDPIFFEVLYSM